VSSLLAAPVTCCCRNLRVRLMIFLGMHVCTWQGTPLICLVVHAACWVEQALFVAAYAVPCNLQHQSPCLASSCHATTTAAHDWCLVAMCVALGSWWFCLCRTGSTGRLYLLP
jgi:hypothetical protein